MPSSSKLPSKRAQVVANYRASRTAYLSMLVGVLVHGQYQINVPNVINVPEHVGNMGFSYAVGGLTSVAIQKAGARWASPSTEQGARWWRAAGVVGATAAGVALNWYSEKYGLPILNLLEHFTSDPVDFWYGVVTSSAAGALPHIQLPQGLDPPSLVA